MAGLTLAPCQAQNAAPPRLFPDTSAKILVFADQLPTQITEAQRRFIAAHYVGSQKQTRAWIRKVRQINPDYLLLHYQLAVGAGPASFLDGDSWINDFDQVAKHEDWFIRNAKGERLLQPDWKWYVMDIRFKGDVPRTGFPDYWLKTCLKRMRDCEADGCFADSYTQDILMNQVKPSAPLFSDVEVCKREWLPNLNHYGAYVAAAFHRQPEKFVFLPNLGGMVATWDKTTNLAVGDGGMNEGFCASGPDNYYSDDDWKLQMNRLLGLAAKGKIVLCQTGIAPAALDHRWFVVGSHLLTKGRRSYLTMFQKSPFEWYPEYTLDLGAYKEEPKPDIDSYWRPEWKCYAREFAKGIVLVNPLAAPTTVTFPTPLRVLTAQGGGAVGEDGKAPGSLSETAVTSVIIPAHSARIALH